jgi:hypothetical protein
METAPARGAGAAPPRAARACRKCREPVTVPGDPRWGKAVHAVTGQEAGPDGTWPRRSTRTSPWPRRP